MKNLSQELIKTLKIKENYEEALKNIYQNLNRQRNSFIKHCIMAEIERVKPNARKWIK